MFKCKFALQFFFFFSNAATISHSIWKLVIQKINVNWTSYFSFYWKWLSNASSILRHHCLPSMHQTPQEAPTVLKCLCREGVVRRWQNVWCAWNAEWRKRAVISAAGVCSDNSHPSLPGYFNNLSKPENKQEKSLKTTQLCVSFQQSLFYWTFGIKIEQLKRGVSRIPNALRRRLVFRKCCCCHVSLPVTQLPLPSSHLRRPVASGGWHGGRRRASAWGLGWSLPSFPLTLFPLPSASRLPAQERLCRWPPGLRLRLELWSHDSGQVGTRRQGQAEEEVCKSLPTVLFHFCFFKVGWPIVGRLQALPFTQSESMFSGAGHATALR